VLTGNLQIFLLAAKLRRGTTAPILKERRGAHRMSFIYCLYSTESGLPRYVGQTCAAVGDRLNQHLRDASRMGRSRLYRWIRTSQSRGFAIRAHLLQMAVHPADMNFYEHYWRQQFAGLLNRTGRSDRRRHTAIGEAVERALRQGLQPASATALPAIIPAPTRFPPSSTLGHDSRPRRSRTG
jgi:hypothetical protein